LDDERDKKRMNTILLHENILIPKKTKEHKRIKEGERRSDRVAYRWWYRYYRFLNHWRR
jgi:hypothetical protein